MKAWWNLTQEEQIKRSKHCAIGSAIIAAIFILLLIIGIRDANAIVERCTASTVGEVISVHGPSRHRLQPTLMANFKVRGVTYSAHGRYSSGYSSFDTLSRKAVMVYYDPSDPTIAYAAEGPDTTTNMFWIAFAAIFGIGSPLFALQAKRIREKGPVWQAKSIEEEQDAESEEEE